MPLKEIALTEKRSLERYLSPFFWMLVLAAGIQMNGAEYSSRPIPQLKHALLKLSDAWDFSFSVYPVVPTSCLDIHSPDSLSRISTVQ